MKMTNTPRNTKRKSGMTLLELTVVILVLLSLISILFVGARAWKKGSDRAGCVMNLRNIQQAVRGDQNMKGKNPGDTGLLRTNIIGTNGYLEREPACPAGAGTYAITDGAYPALGTLVTACPVTAVSTEHVPSDIAGW